MLGKGTQPGIESDERSKSLISQPRTNQLDSSHRGLSQQEMSAGLVPKRLQNACKYSQLVERLFDRTEDEKQ